MMTYYAGLDVSQKETTICIVDEQGRRLWRGTAPTDPEAITEILHRHGCDLQVGVETGPMMPWLVHGLRRNGLDVICLDARHAKAALAMQLNKNDRNDAEGLAQIVRTGWYRSVHVKSFEAHRLRALLGARRQLVGMTTQLSNHIRGILKVFGLVVGPAHGRSFAERVETLVNDQPAVAGIVRPMLQVWRELKNQITSFDKAVRQEVRRRAECRLLMSVPGIGALSVLAFVSAIEHPKRFRQSRNVGAHLGLTPRQYQSGEVDRRGRISKCGDELVRSYLFEAAGVLLTRVQRWSPLKAWAVRLAQRSGFNKARVALARKLAVILHAIWRTGEPFRWSKLEAAAA
jgi:transposase